MQKIVALLTVRLNTGKRTYIHQESDVFKWHAIFLKDRALIFNVCCVKDQANL